MLLINYTTQLIMRLDFSEVFSRDNDSEIEKLLEEVLQEYGCAYLNATKRGKITDRIPKFITDCGCCMSLEGLDYYLDTYKTVLGNDLVRQSGIRCVMCQSTTFLHFEPIPTSHLGELISYITGFRQRQQLAFIEREIFLAQEQLNQSFLRSREQLLAAGCSIGSGMHQASLLIAGNQIRGTNPSRHTVEFAGGNQVKKRAEENRGRMAYSFEDFLENDQVKEPKGQEGSLFQEKAQKSNTEAPTTVVPTQATPKEPTPIRETVQVSAQPNPAPALVTKKEETNINNQAAISLFGQKPPVTASDAQKRLFQSTPPSAELFIERKPSTQSTPTDLPYEIEGTDAPRFSEKGCACEKTHCANGRCGCRKFGLFCGPNCKCSGCKNKYIPSNFVMVSKAQAAAQLGLFLKTKEPTSPVKAEALSPGHLRQTQVHEAQVREADVQSVPQPPQATEAIQVPLSAISNCPHIEASSPSNQNTEALNNPQLSGSRSDSFVAIGTPKDDRSKSRSSDMAATDVKKGVEVLKDESLAPISFADQSIILRTTLVDSIDHISHNILVHESHQDPDPENPFH